MTWSHRRKNFCLSGDLRIRTAVGLCRCKNNTLKSNGGRISKITVRVIADLFECSTMDFILWITRNWFAFAGISRIVNAGITTKFTVWEVIELSDRLYCWPIGHVLSSLFAFIDLVWRKRKELLLKSNKMEDIHMFVSLLVNWLYHWLI